MEAAHLPAHLQQQLRPLHVDAPAPRVLLHADLVASGFKRADALAGQLSSLQAQARALLVSVPAGCLGLGRMRAVVRAAAAALHGGVTSEGRGGEPEREPEESVLAQAAGAVLLPGVTLDDAAVLQGLIDTTIGRPPSNDSAIRVDMAEPQPAAAQTQVALAVGISANSHLLQATYDADGRDLCLP